MPGPVPPEHLAKLEATKAELGQATEAYRSAVADALKAGASVRRLSSATGLAMQTISNWGHERGWPTSDQETYLRMMGYVHDNHPHRKNARGED